MDESNGRRETLDFMNVNVESFSQLPFIRRAPAKEKGAIRLFGKKFGAGDFASAQEDSDCSETTTTKNNTSNKSSEKSDEIKGNHHKDSSNSSSSRRFECHYCFRNFPTSQALGGHQNAHKRERQHAKRGATYLHHRTDTTHVYGFLNNNYHHRHYLGSSSWNGGSPPAARFYGGHTSSYYPRSNTSSPPPTINGSPLGLWRVPRPSTAVRSVYSAATASGTPSFTSNNSTLPLLSGEHELGREPPGGTSAALNKTYWYGVKSNVQDHVSLDLHL